MLMGGYRQWQLPSSLGQPGSDTPEKQMQRLNTTLDQWQNVIRGGHTCIAGWDSNLDMLENNDPLDRYDTREMLEQYTQFISDNSLVQHNHEPTRHMVGQRSTLID